MLHKKEAEKEKPKENIFLVIICIILGLFSLLMALFGFFYGLYFRASLYLIISIFAFLPKKITQVPFWIKLLIIIASLFILFIVGQVSLAVINNNFIYHSMQENFSMNKGDFSIIIYNITEVTSILVSNQTRTTEGYFLFVNCGITNLQKNSAMMSPTFSLIDNKNNTYQGLGFGGYNEYFQHNLEKETYFLFEIPKTAEGIRFVIEDNLGVHIIDLGK